MGRKLNLQHIERGRWAVCNGPYLVGGTMSYGRREAITRALMTMLDYEKIRSRRDRDRAWKEAKKKWSWRLVRVRYVAIAEVRRGR